MSNLTIFWQDNRWYIIVLAIILLWLIISTIRDKIKEKKQQSTYEQLIQERNRIYQEYLNMHKKWIDMENKINEFLRQNPR